MPPPTLSPPPAHQEGRGPGEHGAWTARRRVGEAIVKAADEILNGAPARPVRGRRLPGRRRDVAQHERERGARQPAASSLAANGRYRLCTRTITSTWDSPPTTCSRGDAPGAAARHHDLVDAGTCAGGVACARRPRTFDHLKVGRTHLQDAVPMTLGQEFGGYAACIDRGAEDVVRAADTAGRN